MAVLERRAALAKRLSAILRGQDSPRDDVERLELAIIAHRRQLYSTAARFYAEPIEVELPRTKDGKVHYNAWLAGKNYAATCNAVLAGTGQGKDNPLPDEVSRKRLRLQALKWLRAELSFRAGLDRSGDHLHFPKVRDTLHIWRNDGVLSAVRESDELAKLPEQEKNEWKDFWKAVDVLLEKPVKP